METTALVVTYYLLLSVTSFTFVLTYAPEKGDFEVKLQIYYQHKTTCVLDTECFWFIDDQGYVVPASFKIGRHAASDNETESQVEFLLYRRQFENGTQEMDETKLWPNCTNCLQNFMNNTNLIVISHGFASSSAPNTSFGTTYREGFSANNVMDNTNIIFVNWETLADWRNTYWTAAANVEPVGKYTAKLLNFLIEQKATTLDKIHFVGHSLGSHVGNYVGNYIKGGKIARISALDPALPLFQYKNDSQRIDPSDATFVNVMHTAMGTLLEGGLAFKEPRGHVDFYPNSGKKQPECQRGFENFFLELVGACSHSLANVYFARSINSSWDYNACKSTSWEEYEKEEYQCVKQESDVMGFGTKSTSRGLYYLRTSTDEQDTVSGGLRCRFTFGLPIQFATITLLYYFIFHNLV